MKTGDCVFCKSKEDLHKQIECLLKEGYALHVEFDKLKITINEEPEDKEQTNDERKSS